MRSVYVYPRVDLARAVEILDAVARRQHADPLGPVPWVVDADGVDDPALYIDVFEAGAMLGDGWTPDDLRALERAAGRSPVYCLMINVSGRHPGDAEVRRTVLALLREGGVAQDDHSEHPWTPEEIERDADFDGLGFFDYKGWYARWQAEKAAAAGERAEPPVSAPPPGRLGWLARRRR